MTDITCPQCGMHNPQQSKFCNHCGASFVSDSEHICPTCGVSNPFNLLYCDNCGTRLVDDTAPSGEGEDEADNKRSSRSEPFSLPTRPPGQTGDLDVSAALPDWLRTGDFSGEEGDGDDDALPWLRAAQEDSSWDDDDAPTLEELSSGHAPKDDLPTWLLDEEMTGTIFTSGKSTDELFMASLSEEGDEEEAPAEDQPSEPPSTADELHSWLSAMEDPAPEPLDEPAPADSADSDDDLQSAIEPDEAPEEMEEDDFLQWLSEIQQEEAAGAANVEPEENGDEPADWAEIEETAHDSEVFSDDDDLLGQLAALGDDDLTTAQTPDSAADGGERDEFLQWLDSLESREAGVQESDAPTDDAFADDAFADDLADDEASFNAETSADIEALAAGDDGDDFKLPDWLGTFPTFEEEGHNDEEDSDAPADVSALPDWLQDMAPSGGDLSLPYVSGVAMEGEDEEPEDEAIDSFRKAMEASWPSEGEGEEPEQETVQLPEWITAVTGELDEIGASAERDDEPAAAEAAQREQADDATFDIGAMGLEAHEVTGDDLPDWFSDVLADIEPLDDADLAEHLQSQEADIPEQLAGAALPDWLDSPYVDEAQAEPTPLEEIPEWLRAPLREQLARAAEERGLDEASLESGEEWRDLLEAPLAAEEKRPVQDSVPDWLASMRSAAAGEVEEESAGEDAETLEDSPVAGISGALGIAPVVAQSAHAARTTGGDTAKEQEQQVVLLRQLARLQQDELHVRVPASAAAPPLPVAMRLILTILLLAAVVGGLVGGNLLAGIAPPASQNPIAPIVETLQSAGGNGPLLVVFDYSPAMSGALDAPGNQLLQELAQLDRQILFTSQSATGLALANRAVARQGVSGAVDLSFIPGEALGVRRFGQCLSAASTCTSLFGQDIDAQTLSLLATTQHVVVITADRDSLLAWIEHLPERDDLYLSAVVTPALEPVALPYMASEQLAALAVADGTVAVGNGRGAAYTGGALLLAQWLVAAAIIVGAFYYLLIGAIRARRS